MWPPARRGRQLRGSAGRVLRDADVGVQRQHRLAAVEGAAVGGVAQQRLADALAEDAALAARGAEHVQVDSRPLRSRACARSARRARGRATIDMPDAARSSTPARPGTLWSRSGSSAQLHVLAAGRARARERAPSAGIERAGLPAEPRARASRRSSTPATPESGWWRTVTASMRPQLVAPPRRVEGRGHALAPRRACAARRGRPRRPRSASSCGAREGAGGVGRVHGVDQHDLRQVEQRVDGLVVPVRRPHDRRRSGTMSGSTIVSSRAGAAGPRPRSRARA